MDPIIEDHLSMCFGRSRRLCGVSPHPLLGRSSASMLAPLAFSPAKSCGAHHPEPSQFVTDYLFPSHDLGRTSRTIQIRPSFSIFV